MRVRRACKSDITERSPRRCTESSCTRHTTHDACEIDTQRTLRALSGGRHHAREMPSCAGCAVIVRSRLKRDPTVCAAWWPHARVKVALGWVTAGRDCHIALHRSCGLSLGNESVEVRKAHPMAVPDRSAGAAAAELYRTAGARHRSAPERP